jgi:formate dehydrogenase subunit delta
MDVGKLVKMANQIGEFFAAEPDVDAAQSGIAEHLRKFWAPSMRSALLNELDRAGGADALAPLVRSALQQHRDALMVSPRR